MLQNSILFHFERHTIIHNEKVWLDVKEKNKHQCETHQENGKLQFH